jgi:hypothetical protein
MTGFDDVTAGTSPEENSSFFSKYFFFFLDPLLRLGYKRPVEAGDIWNVEESLKAKTISDRFVKVWIEEKQRCSDEAAQKHVPITKLRPHWNTIKRVFGPKFLMAAVNRMIAESLTIASPIVLLFLIR